MTPKQYENKLREAIQKYGYWSDAVFILNNIALRKLGLDKYSRIHNMVRAMEDLKAKQKA